MPTLFARFPDHPEGPAAVFAAAALLGVGIDLELAAVRAALDLLDEVPTQLFLSINVSRGPSSMPACTHC